MAKVLKEANFASWYRMVSELDMEKFSPALAAELAEAREGETSKAKL
jgi:hypothetical protein